MGKHLKRARIWLLGAAVGAAFLAVAALGSPDLLSGSLSHRGSANVGAPLQTPLPAATSGPTFTLTINRVGASTGQLAIQPASPGAAVSAEPCAQAVCLFTLPRGDYTIAPSGDARVVSWGGACPDGGPICTILVDRARTIGVSIDRAVKTLTLKKLGAGTGNLLLSGPAGMTCGGTCLYDPPDELVQTVTLRAEPAHAFAGWQGACSGSEPTCTLRVDRALEAIGTFR